VYREWFLRWFKGKLKTMRGKAFVLFVAFMTHVASGARLKHQSADGVLELDDITFDKIVGGPRPTFVRFEQEYPYGTANTIFEALAVNSSSSTMLVCTVGVSEHVRKQTKDLAKRFGVTLEQNDKFPVYIFFPAGSKDGLTYVGDAANERDVRQFIREQGIYISLPGCSQMGDELAKAFMRDNSTASRQDILAKTQKLADEEGKESTTKWYLNVMKKLLEKGPDFIGAETARMQKVMGRGSVQEAQQRSFRIRLNILSSFASPANEVPQEEAERLNVEF
jgi:hypothetical protein